MKRTHIYVGGEWVRPMSTDVVEVENPATEQTIGEVPSSSTADVDHAVQVARDALAGWSALSPGQRAGYLDRIWQNLTRRREDIARTITQELGTPIRVATSIQAGLPLTVLRSYADLLGGFPFTEQIGHSLVVKEPVGVVAAITPWNYPLHQMIAKVAPALLAGCPVVLKPAELTPLVGYLLAEAIHEAELPAGVFNLVSGSGRVVGAALAAHPGIDMVSFTGSTQVGKQISVLAADNIKKVALELGGKSANVILDDANLNSAVKVGVGNAMLNAGQTCMAWTRMLVPHSRYEQALEIAGSAARKYLPGDPTLEDTRLGPLSSARQRSSVLAHIEDGCAQGARLVAGDQAVPARGHYVPATVLADVKPDDRVAQEEIFGPVLVVIPYADDAEAVTIANNSPYGLSGAVWSADVDRAMAIAHQLQTGSVDINGAAFNPLAPFGGYKQSGVGRELGRYGLEEFLQTKAIQRPVEAATW